MSLANEILQGSTAKVAAMIANGADPNEPDEYGFTPLIEATIVNKADVIEILLKAGADPKRTDFAGRSPLHWTVENNNQKIAKILLEAGADPNGYTQSSEPILTIPLLRQQEEMKSLLYRYDAKLDFAKDYINAKLIGHRFELTGHTYITNTRNEFILLDLEGFFLEFSLNILRDSLARFKSNFAAKHLKTLFSQLHPVIDALAVAAELISYQQYNTDLKAKDDRINFLLENPMLIIPATYQGHAITFIRFGNLFAKCDRGANSEFEGSVVIYKMRRPHDLTPGLIKQILYKKQKDTFMHSGINERLGLERLMNFPVGPQITGNCSWANVEAAVPTLLFLSLMQYAQFQKSPEDAIKDAIDLYVDWHSWDQDRALDQCIQSLSDANELRRASKILLLTNVLFQTCDFSTDLNIVRAERIIKLLREPKYKPYLDNYIKVYYENKRTPAGENLMHLFDVVK